MKIEQVARKIQQQITHNQIEQYREKIEIVVSQYQEIKKEHPEYASGQIYRELIREIDKEIKLTENQIEELMLTQIQNSVAKHLYHNPHLVKQIYEQLQNKELEVTEKSVYKIEMEQSSKVMIQDIILLGKEKGKVSLEWIKAVIEKEIEVSQETLRQIYIVNLLRMKKFFDQYHLLEEYKNRNNQRMEQLDVKQLQVTAEQIENVFDMDELIKKPIEELVFLTTFYENRIIMEKKEIYNAIFAVEQLDLWEASLYKRKSIDEETIKAVYCKKEIVDTINDVYGKIDGKRQQIKRVQQYAKEYREVFDQYLPDIPNDLANDTMQSVTYSNHCKKNYILKEEAICKLIEYLQGKSNVNWGYHEEYNNKGNKECMMAVDFPGYNMPVVLHVPNAKIVSILSSSGYYSISKYQGNDDFFEGRRRIKTNRLYPLSKEQIQAISEKAKKYNKKDPDASFIHHINAMASGKKLYHIQAKKESVNPQDLGER